MNLDQIDFDLIGMLRENARVSNKELAAKTGLSQSTCLERVRRLTSNGIFTGFHAAVDPKTIGIGVQAMITVNKSKDEELGLDKMQESLLRIPEVLTVYLLAGSRDYLVHVLAYDVDHLRRVCESLGSFREVEKTETALILNYRRSYSLPARP